MNKYTELSDFEINKKVAINVGGFALSLMVFDDRNEVVKKNIPNIGSRVFTEFNPCNNPADAMPIIIENNISLRAPTITDRWKAEFIDEYGNYVGYRRALNKNPLRAAMELFLLIKDAENENNNND
ncbi:MULTISPECIES: phage protein NinX family protein [unclassified Providencia]|uniref:phage protein NinX family protein n=1 Tax=unclassified Providencia TaxID=2633465 RepID=UPI00234BB1CE|nr:MULTISPECIES: phage protein NinX family protein [unclassified Providencia]